MELLVIRDLAVLATLTGLLAFVLALMSATQSRP